MKRILLLSFIVSSIVFFSCTKGNMDSQPPISPAASIELTGLLKQQGVTTYMYGTHILITVSTGFALRSSVINLDQFVNKNVTITGKPVAGYPVDGGPLYIDVQTIK